MIRIFSHYVPGKLIFLAGLEALALLFAAYVGISMHFGSGAAIGASAPGISPQAAAFAAGMLILMTTMGLYHPDNVVRHPVRARASRGRFSGRSGVDRVDFLPRAFAIPEPRYAWDDRDRCAGWQRDRTVRISQVVKPGRFQIPRMVLGTGSRVMKLAEFAQRNHNHLVVGYIALQPSKHYVPLPHVLPMAPGESLCPS